MQAHDNNSNLVVRTPAKKATALSQQVSDSTVHRESRRATQLHNILQWHNYRSLSGDGRRTFTSPPMEEASTKSPPPWMSALSTGLDRQKEGAQPPVKCYSLEKQITNKPLKKHWLISHRNRILNCLLQIQYLKHHWENK